MRVSLRLLQPDDAAAIEPWLAEAVAAVDGVRPGPGTPATLAAFGATVSARWPGAAIEVVITEEHGPIGLIVHRVAKPDGPGKATLLIGALAVRAGLRNLGYGAEAVVRLEEMYPGATVCAAIPRFNGLAIYFWLRVGYRPVRLDEDAELARDPERLWMVRGVSPSASGGSPAR
jgi:predicted N-acetyltransferase YhbS